MKNKNDYLWQKTNEIFHQSNFDVMLSSFVMWVSVFLCLLFPIFGFALAFFVFSFALVGFKSNVVNSIQGKEIIVEGVFLYYKRCISCFCLQICSLVLICLWSILLVFPGIVCGLNYSFAPYIMADNPSYSATRCLNESKKLVYGKRLDIFLVYLMEAFFVLVVDLVFSCLMIILNYFASVPSWVGIVVPLIISTFVFFVFIYPYFEMVVSGYYLDAKKEKQKSSKKAPKSSSNVE